MSRRLTMEEIKKLLIAWREHEDKEAFQLLAMDKEGLVRFIARRYLGKGLTFDELVSAGNEGLVRAINKFDYQIHEIEKFNSYISTAIENQIIMDLKAYGKYYNKVVSFENPIGRNKNGDELKIEDIIGTDAEELVENVISEMKIEIVRDALKCLTSREQQIILLRYGLDEIHNKTQQEIAQLFGCSKALISMQERKALIKMRHPRNTRKLKDFIEE